MRKARRDPRSHRHSVVGVWTHLTSSPSEFVEIIMMMVDAIGIDHVGIGSDDDLLARRGGAGSNRAWTGMTSGFFYTVAGERFTNDEISKVGGGNYCRIFGKVTTGRP
jgi:membrane dipeptidase